MGIKKMCIVGTNNVGFTRITHTQTETYNIQHPEVLKMYAK